MPDNTSATTNESLPIRLDWWRFAFVALMIAGIPTTLVVLSGVDRTAPTVALAMAAFVASTLAFGTWRWHSLRAAVKNGSFSTEDFRKDPQQYLRGPKRVFVSWFALTMALMLVIIASSIA